MVLESIKVVEFAEGVAGPLAGLRLAELGADVVKVEPAGGDYMRGAYPLAPDSVDAAAFLDLNRGKRSFMLGDATRSAASLLNKLLAVADIAITDQTDAQLAELGIGATLEAAERGESKLIHIAITPWGRRGPLSRRKGSELTAQAMAGYTRYLGEFGLPARRLGADVASVGTATFAIQAALAAIYARRRGGAQPGRGQRIDLSLCNTLLSMKSIHLAAQSDPDEYKGPRVGGANHPPELGWKTADEPVFMAFGGSVGQSGRAGWVEFVKEMGLEKMLDDPRCDKNGRLSTGHGTHVHELRAVYEEAFKNHTGEQIAETIRKYRGSASVYQRLDTTLAHAQAQALNLLCEVKRDAGTDRHRRFPARFGNLAIKSLARAPKLGEHSQEIAGELGFPEHQRDGLSK
jgi:crotonobetainyl-CoA:carnitine CoA-transferase CaiB-like acyl-CoA transferase